MYAILFICDLSILGTINANEPHYTHLRFRYTCDDNRKRFAIIVAFAVYGCSTKTANTIRANAIYLRLSY